MSDAPAAPVTENGVPPATQEKVVEETPGFKVCRLPSDVALAHLFFSRFSPATWRTLPRMKG